jgi:hypothetical protein
MAESNSNRFCSPSVFETVLGPAQLTFQIGGSSRDRTDDLLHAMQALSQLSYTPIMFVRVEHDQYDWPCSSRMQRHRGNDRLERCLPQTHLRFQIRRLLCLQSDPDSWPLPWRESNL